MPRVRSLLLFAAFAAAMVLNGVVLSVGGDKALLWAIVLVLIELVLMIGWLGKEEVR